MITALLYAGVLLVCGSSVTDAPNETCSSVGEDLIAAEFAHHELALGAVTSSNMTGEGKGLPWTHWDAWDFTMNAANIVSSPGKKRARHRTLAASAR